MTLPADNRSMSRRLHKPLWAVAALLCVNAVLLVAQPALGAAAGPGGLPLRPKLVRAEVILQDAGGVYDYRIDRGRIRTVSARHDRAPRARRHAGHHPGCADCRDPDQEPPRAITALRRGMTATTVRLGDAPAHRSRRSGEPARLARVDRSPRAGVGSTRPRRRGRATASGSSSAATSARRLPRPVGVARARTRSPSSPATVRIVVLDIGLPGIDGFDVCRRDPRPARPSRS